MTPSNFPAGFNSEGRYNGSDDQNFGHDFLEEDCGEEFEIDSNE